MNRMNGQSVAVRPWCRNICRKRVVYPYAENESRFFDRIFYTVITLKYSRFINNGS